MSDEDTIRASRPVDIGDHDECKREQKEICIVTLDHDLGWKTNPPHYFRFQIDGENYSWFCAQGVFGILNAGDRWNAMFNFLSCILTLQKRIISPRN